MSKVGIKLEGDWEKAHGAFSGLKNSFHAQVVKSLHEVGLFSVRWIVQAISGGQAGGKKFPANHPFTLAQRVGGGQGGKPLMDRGADGLLGSVNYKVDPAKMKAFAGVLKGKKSKDGKDIVDIAAIVHNGTIIPVTKKMRGYLASQGFYLRKETTHLVIPPRRFLDSVLEHKAEIKGLFLAGGKSWITSITH